MGQVNNRVEKVEQETSPVPPYGPNTLTFPNLQQNGVNVLLTNLSQRKAHQLVSLIVRFVHVFHPHVPIDAMFVRVCYLLSTSSRARHFFVTMLEMNRYQVFALLLRLHVQVEVPALHDVPPPSSTSFFEHILEVGKNFFDGWCIGCIIAVGYFMYMLF